MDTAAVQEKSIQTRMHAWSQTFRLFLAVFLPVASALAHPAAGIVADSRGQVFFEDTGVGIWKIDGYGDLARVPGPAYHRKTIAPTGRFTLERLSQVPGGGLSLAATNPTLIFSGDFPSTIGSDGAPYFPEVGRDGRVHIMRLTGSGKRDTFALLPVATEIGPDGKPVKAKWIHELAAGPDRSLYYTEQHSVRRVASDGIVTAVAEHIQVPGCIPPPAAVDERPGPALRDLKIQQDGIVHVAASACSTLLRITKDGEVSTV